MGYIPLSSLMKQICFICTLTRSLQPLSVIFAHAPNRAHSASMTDVTRAKKPKSTFQMGRSMYLDCVKSSYYRYDILKSNNVRIRPSHLDCLRWCMSYLTIYHNVGNTSPHEGVLYSEDLGWLRHGISYSASIAKWISHWTHKKHHRFALAIQVFGVSCLYFGVHWVLKWDHTVSYRRMITDRLLVIFRCSHVPETSLLSSIWKGFATAADSLCHCIVAQFLRNTMYTKISHGQERSILISGSVNYITSIMCHPLPWASGLSVPIQCQSSVPGT